MEQDKRAVPDLSDKQGGEVPAGEMSGDEDPPHGDASAAGSGAHANAAEESDVEGGFEEAVTEESEGVAAVDNADRGAASWSAQNQDREEVPKDPLTTRFRFRAAIAHPTPPTTYRRLPLRSTKQYYPTRFIAAPATTRSAVVSAMPTADHGAMNEARGSTVTCAESDATVDKSSSDESKSRIDANASSTYRLPSRSSSRKQRRPDHSFGLLPRLSPSSDVNASLLQ